MNPLLLASIAAYYGARCLFTENGEQKAATLNADLLKQLEDNKIDLDTLRIIRLSFGTLSQGDVESIAHFAGIRPPYTIDRQDTHIKLIKTSGTLTINFNGTFATSFTHPINYNEIITFLRNNKHIAQPGTLADPYTEAHDLFS